MIEYIFMSDSNSSTKKIAEFIKNFNPSVNFKISENYRGLEIICNFENEKIKNSFIDAIGIALGTDSFGKFNK
jgi:hypothetical protein